MNTTGCSLAGIWVLNAKRSSSWQGIRRPRMRSRSGVSAVPAGSTVTCARYAWRRASWVPRTARWRVLAVFGVLVVEAAAGVPLGTLVAVRRDAARVLQQSGEVYEVPCHER